MLHLASPAMPKEHMSRVAHSVDAFNFPFTLVKPPALKGNFTFTHPDPLVVLRRTSHPLLTLDKEIVTE